MEESITFKTPKELAIFIKMNQVQMEPYYGPFMNLLAAVDLLPQACCGAVKTQREESVDKIYNTLVMSIVRANRPIINKIKLASKTSKIIFLLNGEVLVEL